MEQMPTPEEFRQLYVDYLTKKITKKEYALKHREMQKIKRKLEAKRLEPVEVDFSD